jgi:hypothetical protein
MALTGDWGKADRMLGAMADHTRWHRAFEKAALKEAHRLRSLMVQAFQKSGPQGAKWPPLAMFTQILSRAQGRGDRRPLMNHGDLRNSIQVVKERDLIFVGTHRRTKGRNGEDLVNLAVIHNYGTKSYTIRVTDKMRKFFLWLSIQSGGQISPLSKSTTTLVIRIPPRPWIEPIWESEAGESADRISRVIIQDMLTPFL